MNDWNLSFPIYNVRIRNSPPKSLGLLFHSQVLPLWNQSPRKTKWWMARWVLPAQTLTTPSAPTCVPWSCLSPFFSPLSSQETAGEDTQDGIYACLDHWALQGGGFSPSSLSLMYLSSEPSIYMELKVNQAHAEARPGPRLCDTECWQARTGSLWKEILQPLSSSFSNPADISRWQQWSLRLEGSSSESHNLFVITHLL